MEKDVFLNQSIGEGFDFLVETVFVPFGHRDQPPYPPMDRPVQPAPASGAEPPSCRVPGPLPGPRTPDARFRPP